MIRPLALALLLQASQDGARVDSLLERLRDDSIQVRDRAAAELVELGRAAFPALDRLKASSDPELRALAFTIRREVERQETLRRYYRPGPRITLERENVPLAVALADLARLSGEDLAFNPAKFAGRVTVRLRGATFWEALEELSRAGPPLDYRVGENGLVLVPEKRPSLPAARRGEIAVWLDGLYLTRDYEFTGAPRDTFGIGINAAWEKGVAPVSVLQRLTEVVDDRGRSLLIQERMAAYGMPAAPKGRAQRLDFRQVLQPPAAGAARIAAVKGYLVLVFPTLLEEAAIDLARPQAPVQLGHVAVSIRNARTPKGSCTFELVLTFPPGSTDAYGQRAASEAVFVVDDLGGEHKVAAAARSVSSSGEWITRHETANVTLPEGRTAVQVRLRVIRETLEKKVEFEFRDLPLE